MRNRWGDLTGGLWVGLVETMVVVAAGVLAVIVAAVVLAIF